MSAALLVLLLVCGGTAALGVRNLLRSTGNPPGRLLNEINKRLHHGVLQHLFDAAFWPAACVLAGLLAPFVMLYKLFCFVQAAISSLEPELPAHTRSQLAIVVSGCDSGFGWAVAMELWSRGYTVIAGCFSENGIQRLNAATTSSALRMLCIPLDVTSDGSLKSAAANVQAWLNDSKAGKRRLLSVVCNAGVGTGGPADWLQMSDFERDFSVNFFGTIRTCKAFLPFLKQTATAALNNEGTVAIPPPRLVVVSSMSGKLPVPLLASYSASKHAVAAYASCLRMELAVFGISVTTVFPSFHLTPLLTACSPEVERVWGNLSDEKRAEYGTACMVSVKKAAAQFMTDWAWDAQRVTDALVQAASSAASPPSELIVGADARYGLQLLRYLPPALSEGIVYKWITWSMVPPAGAPAC
eukprot:6175376-Pleurochrysis_carterae.AAC.3